MSRICDITQAHPTRGSVIHRRGLAKKKGGIGQHVTKVVPRTFEPNLKKKRLWVSELKRFVAVKLTARESSVPPLVGSSAEDEKVTESRAVW